MQEKYDKYTIIVSERVDKRLTTHARFLAKVSIESAMRLIQEFETAVKSLETLPERNSYFSAFTSKPRKYRKLLIAKRYLLVYQIKDNIVYIDEMFDCRQNFKFAWLLEE